MPNIIDVFTVNVSMFCIKNIHWSLTPYSTENVFGQRNIITVYSVMILYFGKKHYYFID
jgi:hypothetical protein